VTDPSLEVRKTPPKATLVALAVARESCDPPHFLFDGTRRGRDPSLFDPGLGDFTPEVSEMAPKVAANAFGLRHFVLELLIGVGRSEEEVGRRRTSLLASVISLRRQVKCLRRSLQTLLAYGILFLEHLVGVGASDEEVGRRLPVRIQNSLTWSCLGCRKALLRQAGYTGI
jgi:hypothetical protein